MEEIIELTSEELLEIENQFLENDVDELQNDSSEVEVVESESTEVAE